MNTHIGKTQGGKNKSAAHPVLQKQNCDESPCQFVDNRPKTIGQRNLQEMANDSKQVMQLSAFQKMANNSSKTENVSLLKTMADSHSAQQPQFIQQQANIRSLPDNLKTDIENLSGYSAHEVKKQEAYVMAMNANHKNLDVFSTPSFIPKGSKDEVTQLQTSGIANKLVGNFISDTILNLVGSIASTILPVGDQPRYGPLTGRGFGSFMEAHLVPGKFKVGTRTGDAPTNTTFEALRIRRTSTGEQMYYQGHLLNYWLGGRGDEWNNLVPLTRKANKKESDLVEESVKLEASIPGNEVVYRVRPVYGSWPWQWPAATVKMITSPVFANIFSGALGEFAQLHEAEQHVPSSLQIDWWVTDKNKKTSAYSATISQDYEGSKVYVEYQGQSLDLTNEAWIWSLLEQALAFALRSYLLTNTILDDAARIVVQAMTTEQMVVLLRRLSGGVNNGLNTIIDNSVTGATSAVQVICERYGWGQISAAILGVMGQRPSSTRDSPGRINRDERNMYQGLNPRWHT